MCSNVFENRAVYELMCEKYCRAGRALYAGYLGLQIHTLSFCNTHCFSTATMVARTRLIVRLYVHCLSCFSLALQSKIGPWPPHCLKILNHTQLNTDTHPVGLLWTNYQPITDAAIYTTHNRHKRRISLPWTGFEPAIPVIERPQTCALNATAARIGVLSV